MKTAFLSKLRSMDLSSVLDAVTESTWRIQTIRSGSHPHGYRSNSSPSSHSAAVVSQLLKGHYLHDIRAALHERSPLFDGFGTFVVSEDDWGFDNIWPNPPRVTEMEWFKNWEEIVHKQGPK
jgi:hypothetical protein